jgi:FlaA1/EpsC-like NDP-sugar epimerase
VLLLAGHEVGRRPGLALVALGATILMLGGNRLFVRALADALLGHAPDAERLLVYGAGRGGALALRELRSNPAHAKIPIGFIDDDPSRRGMTLHGLPVLGSLDDLERVFRAHNVDGIVVSTRKLTADRRARLYTIGQALDVRVYDLEIGLVQRDLSSEALSAQPASEQAVPRRVPDSVARLH